MKVSTQVRSFSTRSLTQLPIVGRDKENKPHNNPSPHQKVVGVEQKGKIGLSIKRKIQEMGIRKEPAQRRPL